MKLKPLKTGKNIISPKKLILLMLALFILGIGIGVTVASENNSMFALIFCAIISAVILAFTFLKKEKK